MLTLDNPHAIRVWLQPLSSTPYEVRLIKPIGMTISVVGITDAVYSWLGRIRALACCLPNAQTVVYMTFQSSTDCWFYRYCQTKRQAQCSKGNFRIYLKRAANQSTHTTRMIPQNDLPLLNNLLSELLPLTLFLVFSRMEETSAVSS